MEYGDISCRGEKTKGCTVIGRISVEEPSSSAEKMINQYKDECNNKNTSSCNNLATIHNGVGYAYELKENPMLSAEYYKKPVCPLYESSKMLNFSFGTPKNFDTRTFKRYLSMIDLDELKEFFTTTKSL